MTSDIGIHHLQRKNNPKRSSAVTFTWLGKLGAIDGQDVQACTQKLETLLIRSLSQIPASETPLIVGLAESGIILSSLMHQIALDRGMNAHWICSTRRSGVGIKFVESHSHGPDHVLPLPKGAPTEIWFVEDEITTGKTLFQVAVKLCGHFYIRKVRVFALADSRTPSEIERFNLALAYHDIRCLTETAIQLCNDAQPDLLSYQQVSSQVPVVVEDDPFAVNSIASDWLFPSLRPALTSQSMVRKLEIDTGINRDDRPFDHGVNKSCLLVIGEAVDIALGLVQRHPFLSFQQITLSPWKIDNSAISSCLEIGENYYLYNYEKLKDTVYILSDPIDRMVEKSAKESLLKVGIKAQELVVSSK